MGKTHKPARSVILTEGAHEILYTALKNWWEQISVEERGKCRKMSQEAIARKLYIDVKTVRKILRRESTDRSTLKDAFQAVGVHWDDNYYISSLLLPDEEQLEKDHSPQRGKISVSASPVVQRNQERFCDSAHWPKLEKIGDWSLHADQSFCEGAGIYSYLLSEHEYGREPYIILAKLRFFHYGEFLGEGIDTGNAGIIIGSNAGMAGRSYIHLLMTGTRLILEEVASQTGDDYWDFRHLDSGVQFIIEEGRLYNFSIRVRTYAFVANVKIGLAR